MEDQMRRLVLGPQQKQINRPTKPKQRELICSSFVPLFQVHALPGSQVSNVLCGCPCHLIFENMRVSDSPDKLRYVPK